MKASGPSVVWGIIVPCRNEARVIERKLENLARIRWPELDSSSDRVPSHRLLIVDDSSTDETVELVGRKLASLFPQGGAVEAELVRNSLTPGKCGAVTSAIGRLGDGVDLIGLTDADVVIEEEAFLVLSRAFEKEHELSMGCASQCFVSDLHADGSLRAAGGGPLQEMGDAYDRGTAWVRGFESRRGKLFSVHGQLLSWRASLGLVPTQGLAADDLDLMFQVRARGGCIRKLSGAKFCEVKTLPENGARIQGLRRARAYFQVLEARSKPLGETAFDRAQWFFYAQLPRWAPELAFVFVAFAILGGWLVGGPEVALFLLTLMGLALLTKPGRRAVQLLGWIRLARSSEPGQSESPDSDRWEMQRT